MLRSIIVLISLFALTTAALADDPKPNAKIGKPIRIPANTGFATNVSRDGQTAGILFDNAYVSVDPPQQGARSTHNQTAIQTKVISLEVPYTGQPEESLAMAMDIRGFRSAHPGASVRLVACAGDATEVVNLSGKQPKSVKLKGKTKAALTTEDDDLSDADFEQRIEFKLATHAAKPVLQITLFLVAEQDTDSADAGGALLAVDSIDLSIAEQSKAKSK